MYLGALRWRAAATAAHRLPRPEFAWRPRPAAGGAAAPRGLAAAAFGTAAAASAAAALASPRRGRGLPRANRYLWSRCEATARDEAPAVREVLPGGAVCFDHVFRAPLEHARAGEGAQIEVFVREVVLAKNEEKRKELPTLLFLQGGPGFPPQRPSAAAGGWLGEALKDRRVLLLDQRGTGRSTPVTAQTLEGMAAAEQAEYLAHFRADSIVRDCEVVRKGLGIEKLDLLGQSFGGFCTLTYLSFFPSSVGTAYLTGGLAPVLRTADDVYRSTYRRVLARNRRYYERYPGDVGKVREIVAHLEAQDLPVPHPHRSSGRFLSLQRPHMARQLGALCLLACLGTLDAAIRVEDDVTLLQVASDFQPMRMQMGTMGASTQQQKAGAFFQPMNMMNRSGAKQHQQAAFGLKPMQMGMMGFGHKKAAATGSFVSDDKEVCWEMPAKNIHFTIAALRNSPLEYFARHAAPKNGTCLEQGYKLLLTRLDPCFKATTMWKLDLDPTKTAIMKPKNERWTIFAYNKNAEKKRYNVRKHCFGENGVLQGELARDPIGTIFKAIKKP